MADQVLVLFTCMSTQDMVALVRRDRNHASVIWWSFCNEAGCGDGRSEPAYDFRQAVYKYDGSRYAGANMGGCMRQISCQAGCETVPLPERLTQNGLKISARRARD